MSTTNNLYSVTDGYEAFALAEAFQKQQQSVLFLARDDVRAQAVADVARFLLPDAAVLLFPAWDCLPYDRVSPKSEIVAERMDVLWQLANGNAPCLVIAPVTAAQQRIVPKDAFTSNSLLIKTGGVLKPEQLQTYLTRHGYQRVSLVREPGEYAIRGGLVDLFAIGQENPVRIDLFGNDVEKIQSFDALAQTTTGNITELTLKPASEVPFDEKSIELFKANYRKQFGNVGDKDPLYTSISEGRFYPGLEHWLPLFFDHMNTLFDYGNFGQIVLDAQADSAFKAHDEQIHDFYQSRLAFQKQSTAPYHPLLPDFLYLKESEYQQHINNNALQFNVFKAPSDDGISTGAKAALGYAETRAANPTELFATVVKNILAAHKAGKNILLAAYSHGSSERLRSVLKENGLPSSTFINLWKPPKKNDVFVAILPIEHGFETRDLLLLTEQDILGDRMARIGKKRKSKKTLGEASSLEAGELVVHQQHGIGRFAGLETVTALGKPHDCLRILYEGGDRLFVPVENIDVLTRYGAADAVAALDKLGGVAWQSRRARVKKRLKDMAAELIKIAAAREMQEGDVLQAPPGTFDQFCARFPYVETEDQLSAIEDVLADFQAGHPMDRLICGDVGFGKTEVALRAAFVAAMSGVQVAVIAPTTLLCRQHFINFTARFAGLPIKIVQLSRFVPAKQAKENKAAMEDGTVDIVIGTHALLAESIKFKRLGLVIVDEEQHFGVKQKERMKQMRSDVHVLTLTATPIPRTLQLALSGVRQMSLITTPPVDRLAVRTFVLPFDPVVLREALMREHLRGGQSFVVCPRLEDLDFLNEQLQHMVPELKRITAHGQLAPKDLEDRIQAFVDGAYNLLISTNIVESGLDIPRANTLIIYRADLFGLAQLYQLRGRIGRSKLRGYAYLTWPTKQVLNRTAEERLKIIESLDTLGAGFQLANHDMDLRGGGNLLGEEQSGHIREVGIELFQSMLADAVAEARNQSLSTAQRGERLGEGANDDEISPQINLGLAVLIPESYVEDLSIRMQLYRNLGELDSNEAVDAFAAELIDRFGQYSEEVENLLQIMSLKIMCRKAHVAKLDAGPKGAVVAFHKNKFPNVEGLMQYLQRHASNVKMKPDQKIIFTRTWESDAARVKGVRTILGDLCGLLPLT